MISSDDMHARAVAYARAWSAHDAEAVAGFFAENGEVSINGGPTLLGREAVAGMAKGICAELTDLKLHCDECRVAGAAAIFLWTLEGHHAETKALVMLHGWEEWSLTDDGQIARSLRRFDRAEYDRQVAG